MRWAVPGVMFAAVLGASAARADPGARGRSHGAAPAAMGAQQPGAAPSVEVLVIDATAGDGGVAPTLASLPQHRQPPFNAFTEMRRVSRVTLALTAAPASTALPGGRSATLTLAAPSPGGRYTVNVSFSSGGSIQFVAGAGEPFFTVRSSRANRAMIIGFIVRR